MLATTLLAVLVGQNWVPGPEGIPVPENEPFGQKGTPYTAPGRLFSVEVPAGWGVALKADDPNTVEFQGVGRPGNATLQIRRLPVPKGAHPRQLLLNAIDRRLKKLPGFKVASRRDTTVAGQKAAAITGSYSYQGNIQFPLVLEEVYVVVGSDAYVFHFECFEPVAGNLAADVNGFYVSFQPRPTGAQPGPFVPKAPEETLPDPDAVPF
ncbi:MAG: hypothetical protein HY903_12480 [Deltaproteobacteria bacterium]|nr:hypothetical protein [Deltaproteobacteria bacterium]